MAGEGEDPSHWEKQRGLRSFNLILNKMCYRPQDGGLVTQHFQNQPNDKPRL